MTYTAVGGLGGEGSQFPSLQVQSGGCIAEVSAHEALCVSVPFQRPRNTCGLVATALFGVGSLKQGLQPTSAP